MDTKNLHISSDEIRQDIKDTKREVQQLQKQIRDREEFIDKLKGILKDRGELMFKKGDRVRVIVAEHPFTEVGDTGTVWGIDPSDGMLGVALDKREPIDTKTGCGCYWVNNSEGEAEIDNEDTDILATPVVTIVVLELL